MAPTRLSVSRPMSRLTRRRARRGANAIEFAMLLPVFVALMGFIFEYGWTFFLHTTAVMAVRTGCRAGAVIPPDDVPSPETVAEGVIVDYMAQYNVDCTSDGGRCAIEIAPSGGSPTEVLTCSLAINYQGITGLVPVPDQIGSSAITLFELQR